MLSLRRGDLQRIQRLAEKVDSLVRVSRRVGEARTGSEPAADPLPLQGLYQSSAEDLPFPGLLRGARRTGTH